MVSRAPGGLGHYTVEAQCRQIQFVDERFNNPDRVASGKLAGPGSRVIDELVDHHVRVGSDSHCRLIDKQDLGLTSRSGGDAFVEDDLLAQDQPTWRGTRRNTSRLWVDRA